MRTLEPAARADPRSTVEEDALALLDRDDLPPRLAPNGSVVTDQYTLRLAALEEKMLSTARAECL